MQIHSLPHKPTSVLAIAVTTILASHCVFAGSAVQSLPLEVGDASGQTYRLIQAGQFEMGSRDTGGFRKDHTQLNETDSNTRHAVVLSQPFYLATKEVTVGQFRKFVQATKSLTTAEQNGSGIVGWKPVNDNRGQVKSSFQTDAEFTWQRPGFDQDDSHPVVGISYHDAKAYCTWLNHERLNGQRHKGDQLYRLPTEAEWEYAARAGTETHFSFGDDYRDTIHQHANIANVELERESAGRAALQWLIDVESGHSDGFAFTAPVGTYPANPWGLHDMHGNVWEWCEDRYVDTFYDQFKSQGHAQFRKRAIDPLCTERWNEHGQWQVIRGGSWFVSPQQSRSAGRGVFNANDAACYVGFRVATDIPEAARVDAAADHEQSETALQWFTENAKEVREYHVGQVRIELHAENLNDEVFGYLADLNYPVDLMVRPPGNIDSDTISKFRCIPTLTGFGLATHCADITNQTFAFLADHPELEWLQITGTSSLTDDQLFPHLRSEKLKSIALQGDGITDAGFLQLPPQSMLQALQVSSTACQGETLSSFAGTSPLREVGFSHLTDEAAQQLATFSALQNINCERSPISGAAIQRFATLRKLTTVHLSHCSKLQDEDFAPLANLYHLRQLSVQDTAAGDATVRALAESISLQNLRLGSRNLTDQGMAQLCNIIPLRDLSITAEATEITDRSFHNFWKLTNLQSLTIQAPQVTGTGFTPLSELPQFRRLSLAPKDTSITDERIEQLRQLLTDVKIDVR